MAAYVFQDIRIQYFPSEIKHHVLRDASLSSQFIYKWQPSYSSCSRFCLALLSFPHSVRIFFVYFAHSVCGPGGDKWNNGIKLILAICITKLLSYDLWKLFHFVVDSGLPGVDVTDTFKCTLSFLLFLQCYPIIKVGHEVLEHTTELLAPIS